MNKKAFIISIVLVLIAITLVVVLSLARKEGGKQPVTENQGQPTAITTTPAASEDTDTSDWILFNSQEDSGTALNFTLKYPKNWISKSSIDGGIMSFIPFYKKDAYLEDCVTQKNGVIECHTSGQIAHVAITKALDASKVIRQNTDNEYNIDGHIGYVSSGINESGIINNQYISNKKIWITVPDTNGFIFEFIMALENDNDKNIFYGIIKNIEFN